MAAIESEPDLLDLLYRAGEATSYAPGDVIFEEGDEPDGMFVLTSGTVVIEVGGREVERLSDRGIFGEMALIEVKPRSGTARAETACELAKVDARRFWFLVQETPYFAEIVMKVMASRLRRETSRPD